MDVTTVAGLILGWGGLTLAWLVAGGHFIQLWSLDAFFIVMIGTLGATMISFPLGSLLNSVRVGRNAFVAKEVDYINTIQTLVGFATRARREGLLGLEEEVEQLDDPFLQKGMQLVVDGTDIQLVRNIMETDLTFLEARHKAGSEIFATAGGFAPTLGVIGAVMGLIHVLANVGEDVSMMLKGVATAFVATFYGIGTANLIWLPLANKLKFRSEEEMLLRQMMIEGVCSISAGDNPRVVEEKLKAFLPPKFKQVVIEAKRAEGGAEEAAAPAGK